MRRLVLQRTDKRGFTLIELLLAMSLFTTVMLVATVGFIGINRTYTRGMVKKQLSESIQLTTDELTRSLRAQASNADPTSCSVDCSPEDWSTISFSRTCYLWKPADPAGGLYQSSGPCADDSTSRMRGLLDERFMVQDLSVAVVSGASGLYRIQGTFTTTDLDALSSDRKSCLGSSQNVGVATCAAESFNFIVSSSGART